MYVTEERKITGKVMRYFVLHYLDISFKMAGTEYVHNTPVIMADYAMRTTTRNGSSGGVGIFLRGYVQYKYPREEGEDKRSADTWAFLSLYINIFFLK